MTSAVATKDDLIQMEDRMNSKFDAIDIKFDTKMNALEAKIDSKMDAKINALEERIDGKMDAKFEAFEDRMDKKMQRQFESFQVLTENLAYDFRGANKDKISQHEDRIVALEKRVRMK